MFMCKPSTPNRQRVEALSIMWSNEHLTKDNGSHPYEGKCLSKQDHDLSRLHPQSIVLCLSDGWYYPSSLLQYPPN